MDDKTLLKRLRRTHVTQSTFGGVAAGAFHSKPVNPDGEEAATRIEALEAALADARSFIDEDSPDWRHAKQAQLAAIDAALEGSGNG